MENNKEMYNSIVDKIKSLTPEKKMELVKKYASIGEFSVEYKVVLNLLKDDLILEKVNNNNPSLSVSSSNAIKAYTQPQNTELKKEYGNIQDQVQETVKKEIQKDNHKFSNMLEKALHKKTNDYLEKQQSPSISPNIYTPKI